MLTSGLNRDASLVDEPFLEMDNIQGNIVHGFNKNHQMLLGLRIIDPAGTKEWLRSIHPHITSATEVHLFRKARRVIMQRRGGEPTDLSATWSNIVFSEAGLRTLARRPQDVDLFEDEAFQLGLAARSSSLGDPHDVDDLPGSPKNWKVGGRADNVPDILLIVAADGAVALESKVRWFKESIARAGSLDCFYEEGGEDLPGPLAGHEHFGFKDGVSQPGIRGRVPEPPHEFVTPRLIDSNDSLARSFAAPGKPLIRPGQFVFGYDTQDVFTGGIGRRHQAPCWAKDGSFLVYRRLLQDVPRFWDFMRQKAAEISARLNLSEVTALRLASMLVGRWPSGAPVMRTPDRDVTALAGEVVNNHFRFSNASRIIPLDPSLGLPPDDQNLGGSDFDGLICPRGSHIRKVNPRDLTTEQPGGAGDTLTRRILRRGIPFGPVLQDPGSPESDPARGNRGLLFLSYQTSIMDQFEFLATNWMNQRDAPEGNGGVDLVVGQNNVQGEDRVRRCPVTFRAGGALVEEPLTAPGDWVIPTGGGYFFSPSLSSLREELSS